MFLSNYLLSLTPTAFYVLSYHSPIRTSTVFCLWHSGNVPFIVHIPSECLILKIWRIISFFYVAELLFPHHLFTMKKHKHVLDAHHSCLWVSDVQRLIICGSQLGLARNNMKQHLWIKERFVTFKWVCFSIFLWFETLLHRDTLVRFVFSECCQGFQLPVTLQRPVLAWTLETLSW